jgi:hypothetical protein
MAKGQRPASKPPRKPINSRPALNHAEAYRIR